MSTRPEISYKRPRDVETVRDLLAKHGPAAKLTAGGQSVMILLRQGLIDPKVIVDISDVSSLTRIEVEDGEATVGAAVTYSSLESHSLTNQIRGLSDSIKVIADPQVRNMGTIGGAISHGDPALDIIPILVCLNAKIQIGSADGTRTIPLEDFSTGYMETALESNELVEAIVFEDHDRWGSAYKKHSTVEGGWATVGAAANVRLSSDDEIVEELRVSFAAVADTTVRAPSVESGLEGSPPKQPQVAMAAENVSNDIDPLDDLSGSAGYKRSIAKTMAERAITEAIHRVENE